jgi:phage terminase large subunit-like protein
MTTTTRSATSKAAPAEVTPTERGLRYARAVVAGDIPACQWVRLACQRHLRDLARAKVGGWAYTFDAAAGDKVCRFIELLPHVKGQWAANHERIRLEPWQCWLTSTLFGWKVAATGKRRFRTAYVALPRKNGKSLWAATIGLYMLTNDKEAGAEVYSGATTEKQAWEVFRPAHGIAGHKTMEKLREAYGVEVNAKTLAVHQTGSRFEPMIGKPGDGPSPSCAIVDEYHEHNTSEQYDAMRTGMGARQQPLLLVITTAGVDTAGPCYALQQDVEGLLRGLYEDDTRFGVVYGIDEEDDWTTEEALKKANPNWGVSIIPEGILAERDEAVRNARKQATFKTKHLNVWCGSREPFFNLQKWQELGDAGKREDYAGEPAWMGMDLASKVDFADTLTLYRRRVMGEDHYYCFARHYLPEDAVADPTKGHYRGWVAEGRITVTDGPMIDFDTIKGDILDDAKAAKVRGAGFDPYAATMLVTELLSEGVPMVEVGMTVKNLSEPMKFLEALILAGRIHHDGDPVLAWMMSNVTAREDANGNVFPRKERVENKIDGAVALIIAMGRAIADAEPVGSVYETRGMRVL